MVGDFYPQPDMFDVPDRRHPRHGRLPSESREFAPTPGGWAGIIVVTLLLAWLLWQLRESEAGLGWLVASVVLGYYVAVMGWTAIRRERDRREDRYQDQ